MNRLYPQLKQLHAIDEDEPPAGTQVTRPRTCLRLNPNDKEAMTASRVRSRAVYQQVQKLRKTGYNIRQTTHKLGMSRTTD